MFNNTIFTIDGFYREEEKHIARIFFDPHHEIFKGHFPDKKVVPGVILMQMVKEAAQQILDLDKAMITAASMKFLNPVLVEESDKLEVEIFIEESEKNFFKVKSIGKDKTNQYFKINISLI